MGAIFWTVLVAMWTLGVVRLVAARATLSDRTVAAHLALGMLLGTLGGPASQKLFAPYGDSGPWVSLLAAFAQQSVLLMPVFALRRFAALSVADTFLIAFATGFGCDVAATLLAAAAAGEPFADLRWMPPFVVQTSSLTTAGYGYWTALVALAYVAARRIGRHPRVTILVTGVAFLLVSTEAASLARHDMFLYRWTSTLTMSGWLTPWLTLVGAIALAIHESQWAPAPVVTTSTMLDQWLALARGRFADYETRRREAADRIQRSIVARGLAEAPDDETLRAIDSQWRVEQWASESGTTLAPAALGPAPWRFDARTRNLAGWTAVVLIFVLLPGLPAIWEFFWGLWIFHAPMGRVTLGTLNAVLVAVLLWRYVMAPGRPAARDAEAIIANRTERLLLQTALGVVILVVIHGHPEMLYPFGDPIVLSLNARYPGLDARQVATFYCLLGVAATGLTLASAARWESVPIEDRRASALRQIVQVFVVVLIASAMNLVYTTGVPMLHQHVGEALFNVWGRNGNYVGALMIAVITASATLGLYVLVQPVARRVEAFLAG